MFFLTTYIFLPLFKKNKEMAVSLAKLEKNVKAVEKYKSKQLDSLELSLKDATKVLEKKFLPAGKVQLTEQLTEVSSGSDVVFSNISYRTPTLSKMYHVSTVDVNLKASFYDFITYITQLEANELMVGIQSLSLHNISPGTPSLEARAVFLGFRLLDKRPSVTKYIEEKYQPIDEGRLEALLEPVDEGYKDDLNLAWKDIDPFFSIHDLNKLRHADQPEITEVTIGAEISGIEDLKLKGILRLRDKKVALINDRIVKEGEKIAGARLLKIEEYHVVLEYAEQQFILKMGVESGFLER